MYNNGGACECSGRYLLQIWLHVLAYGRNRCISIGKESTGFGLTAVDFGTTTAQNIFCPSSLKAPGAEEESRDKRRANPAWIS